MRESCLTMQMPSFNAYLHVWSITVFVVKQLYTNLIA